MKSVFVWFFFHFKVRKLIIFCSTPFNFRFALNVCDHIKFGMKHLTRAHLMEIQWIWFFFFFSFFISWSMLMFDEIDMKMYIWPEKSVAWLCIQCELDFMSSKISLMDWWQMFNNIFLYAKNMQKEKLKKKASQLTGMVQFIITNFVSAIERTWSIIILVDRLKMIFFKIFE